MNRLLATVFGLVCWSLFAPTGQAQSDTAWVEIHPMLGYHLGPSQADGLGAGRLLKLPDIKSADFYYGPNDRIVARYLTADGIRELRAIETKAFKKLKANAALKLKDTYRIFQEIENAIIAGQQPPISLITWNGDQFSGQAMSIEGGKFYLETDFGMVSPAISDIMVLEWGRETAKAETRNGYQFPNPQPTRYVFAPSAIPLEKGEGYYQNFFLFFNSAYVGLTDHITVGGGFEILSTLLRNPILFATVKAGTQVSPNLYLGGGVIVGGSIGNFGVAAPFGSFTVGNPDHHLTFNAGYGTGLGEGSSGNLLMTLAGTTRLTNRLALVSENWVVPTGSGSAVVPSLGVRIMGEAFALDLGLFNFVAWENGGIVASGFDVFAGLPYVGATVNF